MSILSLKRTIKTLKDNLKNINNKIILSPKPNNSLIFSKRKVEYNTKNIDILIKKLKEDALSFPSKTNIDLAFKIIIKINDVEIAYSEKEIKKVNKLLDEIEILTLKIIEEPSTELPIPRSLTLPAAIKDEVLADLNELRQCFKNKLYRSSIILCGRMLEVTLHRKYFEITKRDILETQPGIGLGKLVAKLYEKKALFDPGINEQIHLINKVRIHSVHKKQELHISSKEQTYATILYTIDIVNRLFK